jgi:hypothetical protein
MPRALFSSGCARIALPVALALCSASGRALAQAGEGDSAELAWSVGSGCGLVLASMAVGGGVSGVAEGDRARRTGLEIVTLGLALGPAVSHAVSGEWKRAGLFGGIGLGIAAFNLVLIEKSTAVLDHGPASSRVPFGIALATQVLVTTVGLVDSLMVRERKAGQRLALLPLVERRALGLALGGRL